MIEQKAMKISKKSLAIVLVLVVIIGLFWGCFGFNYRLVLSLFSSGTLSLFGLDYGSNPYGGYTQIPNAYAGYTQIKVYENRVVIGLQSQVIGEYRYYLTYYPTTYGITTNNGYFGIQREDEEAPTQFPLNTGVSNSYMGITFVITQVQPEYIIIMARATS